jgi:hypothetical protein
MRRTQWRWFDFFALLVFLISLGVLRHKPGVTPHTLLDRERE